MSKRNRATLKNFFRKGAMPSEEQFGDLIDSSLNMVDEGFSKTPEDGFEITTLGEHENLVSFFRGNDPERPTWSIAHGHGDHNLLFNNRREEGSASPALALDPEGRVGINNGGPEWDLDVNGVIRARGRIGCNPTGDATVPADGRWHDITGSLTGCHAFEVVAGAGKRKTGRYALMHAIALNTFNPGGFFFNLFNLKKRISYTQAYYFARRDKLRLRWHQEAQNYHYTLQIRSNTDYGEGIRIMFGITSLWFDERMIGSWGEQEGEVPPE